MIELVEEETKVGVVESDVVVAAVPQKMKHTMVVSCITSV
jgi:hypothetical protein